VKNINIYFGVAVSITKYYESFNTGITTEGLEAWVAIQEIELVSTS
jgi:hypothetical protein